ncbi:MAG: UbiA family prenyltransferase [Halobacteriota archaeon]|nr:UbiA family prenyltransferase [Halobacteriota archaeon]
MKRLNRDGGFINIEKIKGIIILERPQYSLLALLCATAGIFLASRENIGNIDVILLLKVAFLFWFLNCVAHPINDYYDREADKHGRPNAPIPADLLSLDEVKAIAIINYVIAIVLIAIIPPNWACRTMAIVGLFFTYSYSAPPFRLAARGILGDLTVAAAESIAFIGGWTAVVGWRYETVSLVVALMIGTLCMVGKTAVDIVDVKGDKESGRVTLPMQIGIINTFNIAVSFAIFEVLLFLIIYPLDGMNLLYLPIGLIGLVVTFMALFNLRKDFGEETGRRYTDMLVLPIFIFLIGVIVGSI